MRRQVGKNEFRELQEKITGYPLDKKKNYAVADDFLVLENNEPIFFLHEGKYVPTLRFLLKNNFLKKAVVDMGAVKFVVGGADIMRPGIKEFDDFTKDEVISIVDIKNRKPIAVGIALFSSEEMKQMQTGKAIKNIHYVGDKLWSFEF